MCSTWRLPTLHSGDWDLEFCLERELLSSLEGVRLDAIQQGEALLPVRESSWRRDPASGHSVGPLLLSHRGSRCCLSGGPLSVT